MALKQVMRTFVAFVIVAQQRGLSMPVYFLRAGHDGPVKIGWAINPDVRKRDLQTGHYERLKIIRTIDCDPKLERILHKYFAEHHITGEWFHFHSTMLDDDLVDVAVIHIEKRPYTSPIQIDGIPPKADIDFAGCANFRAWRQAMGYTQHQAAEILGYARGTVQIYDEGKKTPSRSLMLAMYAIAQGIPPYGYSSEFYSEARKHGGREAWRTARLPKNSTGAG
jgi:DNA-binding XRE family transcriptional regulator